MNSNLPQQERPKVFIVGCGFGGLNAAKHLRDTPVDVVLIDKNNYYLFQPLLYQVASGALNPSEIAGPIRSIFRNQQNAIVVLGEVASIDLEKKEIVVKGERRTFDYLVLAAGATDNYFGKDQWKKYAPGLKTLDSALGIRAKILLSFEAAEVESDEEARRAKLTFVIIGGGPTGVEMAGAIKELAVDIIAHDFKLANIESTRVILVEAGDRVLPSMPIKLSERAKRDLEEMGIEVILGKAVTDISEQGVRIGDTFIRSENVIWGAGVRANPLTQTLGVELGPGGRVPVGQDLSVRGFPNAFAIGDICEARDPDTGKAIPGLAQPAIQMGKYVADIINAEVSGDQSGRQRPFRYVDKGLMATIGRTRAVAQIRRLCFGGFAAWLMWLFIHILFLIGFRNRVVTLLSWIESYLFFKHGSRLIIGRRDYTLVRPFRRQRREDDKQT